MRDHPPAGWSIPPHLHRGKSETTHVLEGEFGIVVDGRSGRMEPGDTVHIPAGVVHSAVNRGGEALRLVLFAPGSMDELFTRIGTRSPTEPVNLETAAIEAHRQGWRFISE